MSERDTMKAGVVFVGGGPAGLSGALHLTNLIARHNAAVAKGEKAGQPIDEQTLGVDMVVAVIEKAANLGDHSCSGAVIEPKALAELIPDYKQKGAPIEAEVKSEGVYFLTKRRALRLPWVPPPMRNHGNLIISLGKLVKWLGEQLAAAGVEVLTTFAAQEVLYEDRKIVGVRLGDKGVNPDGTPKGVFEAGPNLLAKCTVLCEGTRGSCTKELAKKLALDDGQNPQAYATGVKEVWEFERPPLPPGHVIHTMGYPMDRHTFGGSFIYALSGNRLALGVITGLDYRDPLLDPHVQFCRFKQHPFVSKLLRGGKVVAYGAKTIPEGGYYSIPRLATDGALICGDGGGLLAMPKLKGVHYAMKSGMLAAEVLFEALEKNAFSAAQVGKYEAAVANSYIVKDMYRARNFRALMKSGLYGGTIHAALMTITCGRYPLDKIVIHEDHEETGKVLEVYPQGAPKVDFKYDNQGIAFDKLTDVYHSGTRHEEKQPCHLKVDTSHCERCAEEYGNPCERFCPASVYVVERDEDSGKFQRLRIDFSNCVHCKTCDIKDPYGAITWVPPEGGGGPQYKNL
ncbi:MAG: electron transfer flavoprotein-ubiquinone oxidoreductase [Deltaproteobacteria bacterium]|nr:electron transfer flavoprotein-ubiquinone oxidoreductase [Deltaproteobacteria bacterium]